MNVVEQRPSWQLLPLLEDLQRRLPETRCRNPFELSCLLWSLGYSDALLSEAEITEALAVLRALDSRAAA